MDEASFTSQRETIDRLLKEAADKRLEAGIIEQHAHAWLMDLLKVANQEPWWGEAND